MKNEPPITVTDLDIQRLFALVAACSQRNDGPAAALRDELDRANVVDAASISPRVITMSSRALLRDEQGRVHEATLVYPWGADADGGKISVLAPLGRALLGASVGDRVEVVTARGVRAWQVEAVHYQPEAAGNFEL